MTKHDTYQLDDDIEEEIIEILISYLGISRMVARFLTYLRKVDVATSFELEKRTGLPQPEISKAMKELKDKGLDWINEGKEKKSGIGRPNNVYSLKVEFNDIIMYLENKQKKAIDDAIAAGERLKQEIALTKEQVKCQKS